MTPTEATGMEREIAAVYTDGGLIGGNPSAAGGSWCYCRVDAAGVMVDHASGAVTPADLGQPVVTNNVTELLAAVLALESLPERWEGLVYTDSGCTLKRITAGRGFAGVPDELQLRCLAERARLGPYRVVLLAGHPTRDELFRGYRRKKDGRRVPVSKWNAWADERCGYECRRLAAGRVESGVTR